MALTVTSGTIMRAGSAKHGFALFTASRLHHRNSFVLLLLLYRAKYNAFEQFDISFQAHGFSRHELIMARISPALLYLESFWNGFHSVGSPKLCHLSGIIKQGYASV